MPITLKLCQLCSMLRPCYYAKSYAGIMRSPQAVGSQAPGCIESYCNLEKKKQEISSKTVFTVMSMVLCTFFHPLFLILSPLKHSSLLLFKLNRPNAMQLLVKRKKVTDCCSAVESGILFSDELLCSGR